MPFPALIKTQIDVVNVFMHLLSVSPLECELQKVMDFCLINHYIPRCFLSTKPDILLHPRVFGPAVLLLRTLLPC